LRFMRCGIKVFDPYRTLGDISMPTLGNY